MDGMVELSRQLDGVLGDPRDSSHVFSFARRVADDESEHYPDEALTLLSSFGMQRYYVPPEFGGALHRMDHLGAILRSVARRDLSVAVTHAISFLGSIPVWISGDIRMRKELAKNVLAGERVSMALTEEECGSDLLNMNTSARSVPGGYHVQGEKWLVNGLNRNRFVTVYARTAEQGGARGYSLFLFDKESHPSGYEALPKISTLGVRSADISGIRINSELTEGSRIGAEGSGFEIVMKSLQLSRTLCGSLSLGVLDTCLDSSLSFALERAIYGKKVSDLPQSQKLLSEAWADLLIADSLTGFVLRELHHLPEQASVHSSVVKYLVPTLAEQSMHKLSVVLGARYYLRDVHDAGIFQKMMRDNFLISLFDGSTQVNLHILSHHLRLLVTHYKKTEKQNSYDPPVWMRRDIPLLAMSWDGLSLACNRDILLDLLPSGIDSLYGMLAESGNSTDTIIVPILKKIVTIVNELIDGVGKLSPAHFVSGDPQAFEMARRYCVICCVSAVLSDLEINRNYLGATLAQPEVLTLMLHRLMAQLGESVILPSEIYRTVFAYLLERRSVDGNYGLYC